MEYGIREKIAKLLDEVSSIEEVKAIGQTGDINAVPKAGESDIDIFVLCDRMPAPEDRKAVYDRNSALFEDSVINLFEGGFWGTGDVFTIDGVETMLMYFSVDETLEYVNEVLDGRHPDKVRDFYPVGRCATLKNISIIYDEKDILGNLKQKLAVYPVKLKKTMLDYHLGKTKDEEDFGRALLRKDVLFYHQVLETSIDHFLQALFAVNETFFPSRKRTKQYIGSFPVKPENCYERLLETIKYGSSPEGIERSQIIWCGLVGDLQRLCKQV